MIKNFSVIEILLICPRPSQFDYFSRLLSNTGNHPYHLNQVSTFQKAFDWLRSNACDIIILDFLVKESYQFELLASLRAFCPHLPVIVVNGISEEALSRKAIQLGAHDYLFEGDEKNTLLLPRILRYAIENQKTHNALQFRYEFEKLIASISTHFINLTVDQIDQEMDTALGKICEFSKADRGYIFWYSDPIGRHMERIHEWCAEGIPSQMLRIREINMGMFPCFDQIIKRLEAFAVGSVEQMPAEMNAEKKEFSEHAVKSFIFVPMIYGGKAIGFIGFESVKVERHWSDDAVSFLRLVSEIFVNALERKRADKTLRESEERYALAAQGVNDGLWDWNFKTNQIFYSKRWKSMLGYDEEQISDHPNEWFGRIHPDDYELVRSKINLHIEGISDHFEIEHRMLHKDSTYRWILSRGLIVKDSKGRVYRMAGSQTDITDRKKAEEQLLHNALHDNLTDLPSRALFLDRLEYAIERLKSHPDYSFAVLFIDMDGFKAINDSFGHLVGDTLLIEVARRLECCVSSLDTVARFGGDEFIILLDDARTSTQAIQMAETIQKELQLPFRLKDQTVILSASIGISMSDPETLKAEDLLRNADTAMYQAKSMKRGHHIVFTPSMHAQVLENLRMETDLRQATTEKNFEVYYQPILHMESKELIGFEALLRWRHPERGLISPAVFIPIAEETGLIIPIGLWVLRESCQQIQFWKKHFNWAKNLTLSVNLSVKQFMQPDLVEEIQKILDETGLNAADLKLEITESIFMENTEVVADILRRLQEMGIQLLLDDFGTGYSSLSYLHRFKLNALKIDRSFVKNLRANGENSEIVRAIMLLAHNLNMAVIAEGIETEEQLEVLQLMGCDYAQGFLFSKPLDTRNAEKLLSQTN